MTKFTKLLSQYSFADLDKILSVKWAPYAPELCTVTYQCVCHLRPFKSEIDLHLAMTLRKKMISHLAPLHHTTVRFSALFANPLPKTISDFCRNIASIPTYSFIIMFDIKGQIPDITLFLLFSFICFFNGRYSRDYALELWNWPGENTPSF